VGKRYIRKKITSFEVSLSENSSSEISWSASGTLEAIAKNADADCTRCREKNLDLREFH
jgi:hypothetical protein